MSHIAPLPREAITDPEMIELIAQSEKLGMPDDLFPRIIVRTPEQAKPLMRALLLSHAQGNVDHRLKEIIRVLLARFANDKYLRGVTLAQGSRYARIDAGCYEYESDASFTEAEKWAPRYADQMFLDATKIDAAFYNELKKHYSEPQIMELGAFIAFHYGMQMFMRSIGAAAPKNLG